MFSLSPVHGFGKTPQRMLHKAKVRGVPFFLGAVLLTASAFKMHQLATGPTTEDSLLTSRWFLIALVEAELALGLFLLIGAYPKQARHAALAAFTAFSLMSLYHALTGAASCGCFGKLHISPWSTLLFDLLAAAALWRWVPSASNENMCIYGVGEEGRTLVRVLSAS